MFKFFAAFLKMTFLSNASAGFGLCHCVNYSTQNAELPNPAVDFTSQSPNL
jgi:hypothetical protein